MAWQAAVRHLCSSGHCKARRLSTQPTKLPSLVNNYLSWLRAWFNTSCFHFSISPSFSLFLYHSVLLASPSSYLFFFNLSYFLVLKLRIIILKDEVISVIHIVVTKILPLVFFVLILIILSLLIQSFIVFQHHHSLLIILKPCIF